MPKLDLWSDLGQWEEEEEEQEKEVNKWDNYWLGENSPVTRSSPSDSVDQQLLQAENAIAQARVCRHEGVREETRAHVHNALLALTHALKALDAQ